MKTTRFALTAVLAVMALLGSAGCSQTVMMASAGGVEHAGAFNEVMVDRDPHAMLARNAATHALPQPDRLQSTAGDDSAKQFHTGFAATRRAR